LWVKIKKARDGNDELIAVLSVMWRSEGQNAHVLQHQVRDLYFQGAKCGFEYQQFDPHWIKT
jgi:hypothetical protein